jgi:hypothetical protein
VWVLTEFTRPHEPVAFPTVDAAKKHAARGRKRALSKGDLRWYRISPALVELAHHNSWDGVEAHIRRIPLRGEPS